MRVATWNVNSLRSRIDRVEALLQRHDIDVLALQETKAREDQLPLMGLQALGYDVVVAGSNQWNGVAILSRIGIEDVEVGFDGMPGYGEPVAAESRAIGAVCGGLRVWSVYVPNGRKPDDPHYVYKLEWLRTLRAEAHQWLDGDAVIMGDWNVAPRDEDVFDMAQFAKSHARDAAGARGVPGLPRRRLGRRGPAAACRAPRSTPTGTTTGSDPSATGG